MKRIVGLVNCWTVLLHALLLVVLSPGFNSTQLHLGIIDIPFFLFFLGGSSFFELQCDADAISPSQKTFDQIDCVITEIRSHIKYIR